ncbi:MAG TPA: hypothetical protein ENK02_14840 [Planctomycetes bacterium]|nr:hypothetical protein [Planctomycetota bacterium]
MNKPSEPSFRRMVRLVALGLFSFLLPSPLQGQSIPPRQGEAFPLLRFPLLGGKKGETRTLAAWRGHKVLLIQFASW